MSPKDTTPLSNRDILAVAIAIAFPVSLFAIWFNMSSIGEWMNICGKFCGENVL